MSTAVDVAPEAKLPDRYEVVNGRVVELLPMSGFASEIANRLRDKLGRFGEDTASGRARMDMLFHIPLPEDRSRNREPDAAFISFERWPESRPMPYRGNPVDVVPDVIVEVASPTDEAEELLAKAFEYLRAGVRLVWLVYPRVRMIQAYTAPGIAPRVFNETDTLDGGDVLPGFATPVAALFPAATGVPEVKDE